MMNVREDREVWRLSLELLPRNPHGKAGKQERRKKGISLPPILAGVFVY